MCVRGGDEKGRETRVARRKRTSAGQREGGKERQGEGAKDGWEEESEILTRT